MSESSNDRLKRKYSGNSQSGEKKELSLPGRNDRDRAMKAGGKPKNLSATVRRLFSYLSAERALLVCAVVSSLVYTLAALAASYMLRPIINSYIYYDPSGDNLPERLSGLALGLTALAAVYSIAVLTQWLQGRLMLSVSQRSQRRMRSELYSKLQTLPISYFDTHAAGDIMSRFTNDCDTVGEMLNTTLIQIISGAVTIIGTIILMLCTSPILGMITLIMTPLLTLTSKLIVKKGRGAYSLQQKNIGVLNGFSEETISGMRAVKVFAHEETARNEFAFLNDELCASQITAQFRAGIMGPVTHQLCNLSYALTACIGGILVVTRGFDIGGLTVSVNYTRQFNRPINEISMQMNTVFAALAGAERIFELLDEKPEECVADPIRPEKLKGSVVFENVSFSYIPGRPVLHNISLYAKPGQRIALVGSTGAGKTTITNLLTRFYDTDSGTITIDGKPIERLERSYLRESIAMVLQDTHLFSGSVRENIRYGRLDATDAEVEAAAKAASAHSFIMHLENGYDTILEYDGANLSQGQRQLLSIARAAISHAPILILDEATSSVDTRTERQIEKGMDTLMESRTTFVIAHRLSTVRKANAIMVLEHGGIIERGSHDELIAAGGRYAALCSEKAQLE